MLACQGYGAAINACSSQWALTLWLLRLASREKIFPGERAWSSFFGSCGTQWELALALSQEALHWDLTCYNSVLHILASAGKWLQALSLVHLMRASEQKKTIRNCQSCPRSVFFSVSTTCTTYVAAKHSVNLRPSKMYVLRAPYTCCVRGALAMSGFRLAGGTYRRM